MNLSSLAVLYLILTILQQIQCSSKHIRVPIYGNFSNILYTIDLYVGSPPVKTPFVIDTGSSLTVLPCSTCKTCPFKKASFTSSKQRCNNRERICSNKCQKINQIFCEFTVRYLDKAEVSGQIIHDQFQFTNDADAQKFEFLSNFGCIQIQNDITFGSYGLIGLSPNSAENILYDWFDDDPERGYEFTICLAVNGGYMQMGNPHNEERQPDFKGFWSQECEIDSNGKCKFISNGLLLDTGSTVSILPTQKYQEMLVLLIAICQKMQRVCQIYPSGNFFTVYFIYTHGSNTRAKMTYEEEINKIFPNFEVVVGDYKFVTTPSQYLEILQEESGTYMLGAKFSSAQQNIYILGMSWLQKKKITFNIKDETISITNHYDCSFKQVQHEVDNSSLARLNRFFDTIDPQTWGYIALGIFLFLLLLRKQIAIFAKWLNNKIKEKCDQLKKYIKKMLKKKPKKLSKKQQKNKNKNKKIKQLTKKKNMHKLKPMNQTANQVTQKDSRYDIQLNEQIQVDTTNQISQSDNSSNISQSQPSQTMQKQQQISESNIDVQKQNIQHKEQQQNIQLKQISDTLTNPPILPA